MTTRRRRAGSETCSEDQFPVISIASNTPSASLNILTQTTNSVKVPWVGTPTPSDQSQAYYKKTDSSQLGNQPASAYQSPNNNPNNTFSPGVPYQQYQQQQFLPNQLNSSVNNHSYNNHSQNSYPGGNVTRPQKEWTSDVNRYQVNDPNNSGYGITNVFDNSFGANKSADLTDTADMASKDRTQEFNKIIKTQQGYHSNGVVHHRNGKKPQDIRKYSEFMQRSKLIGRNISSTYAKLEKLTHLAKKRSLFDDCQDLQIQELIGIIRHDLTSLTKQLEDLWHRSRIQPSLTNHGSAGHLQKHSDNLVGSLKSKVASITQRFKDVLEVRTENLKQQAQRRDEFTGSSVSGALPSAAVLGHHQGSVLLADEANANNHISPLLSGATGGGGGEVAINMGGGGMYQNQLQLMEEQDTYLQSRADTMKTIESTIVELGQMFTQLATMVHEQEKLVERIDSNVDDAEMNVEAAHSELMKYFRNVSSNRWLMIKVFGIMVVFFVVFVVFMA